MHKFRFAFDTLFDVIPANGCGDALYCCEHGNSVYASQVNELMDEHDRIFTDGVCVGDMLLEIDGVSVDALSIEGAKQAIFGAFGSVSDMMLRQASTGVVYRLRVKRHIPIRLWHAWNAAYQSPRRQIPGGSEASPRTETSRGSVHDDGARMGTPLDDWTVGVGSPVTSPHKDPPHKDADSGDIMTPRGRIVRSHRPAGGLGGLDKPLPFTNFLGPTQADQHEQQQGQHAVQDHGRLLALSLTGAPQKREQHAVMDVQSWSEQREAQHSDADQLPPKQAPLPPLPMPGTPKALLRAERVTSPAVTPGEFSPNWYAFREDWPASSPRLEAKHALYTSVQAAMQHARNTGDLGMHKMLDEVERMVSTAHAVCMLFVHVSSFSLHMALWQFARKT